MKDNTNRLKTIITPSGYKVTMLEWITGREFNEIQAPFLNKIKIKGGVKDVELDKLPVDALQAMQVASIGVIVKSIEAHQDIDPAASVVDQVLDMRLQDMQAVMSAIDLSKGGKLPEPDKDDQAGIEKKS